MKTQIVSAAALAMLGVVGASPAMAQQAPIVRGTAADLRVLRPIAGEIVSPSVFPLEVSFTAKTQSRIKAAELSVDGVRWVRRDFESPYAKFVLSFEIDGRSLTAGLHSVVVTLIAEDGNTSEVTVPVNVDGVRTAPAASFTNRTAAAGPDMAFRALPKKLMGAVEIGVNVKDEHLHPYVSFFVDKQFKTLKNYPPYSFVWDTTSVGNGYHLVEATAYIESANATSTQKMQVYVDNPGGFTTRVAPTPMPKPVVVEPAAPKTVTTSVPGTVIPSAAVARLSAITTTVVEPMPSLAGGIRVASRSLTPMPATVVVPAGAVVAPAPDVLGTPALAGIASKAIANITPIARPVAVAPVSAAAPRTTVKPVVMQTVKRTMSPVVRAAAPVANMPKLGVAALAKLPELSSKTLQIAFDGTQIAFDVAPRIENGLPLAPFRQIFEHTGGQVSWAHNAKTVRAVNADREVSFKVGGSTAKVNGENVNIGRKVNVESGRAIVPLSFVGQALDVDVNFDPATGRLEIKSQK